MNVLHFNANAERISTICCISHGRKIQQLQLWDHIKAARRRKRRVRNCVWPQSVNLFPLDRTYSGLLVFIGQLHQIWIHTMAHNNLPNYIYLAWNVTVCNFNSFTQTTRLIFSDFHLQTCNYHLTQTLKPHMCTLRVQNYPQKNAEFKVITATMY